MPPPYLNRLFLYSLETFAEHAVPKLDSAAWGDSGYCDTLLPILRKRDILHVPFRYPCLEPARISGDDAGMGFLVFELVINSST